jgi:outer membrane protein W
MLVYSGAYAQPDKGRFLIAGNMSYVNGHERFRSVPDDDSGNTFQPAWSKAHYGGFQLASKIGYFPIKNLAVGLSLPVTFSTYTYEFTQEAKQTARSLQVGPFVRYYLPLNEKLFAFSEVSYRWGFSHTRSPVLYTDPDQYTTYNQKFRQFQGGLGLAYFFTRNLGAELLLSYQRNNVPSQASSEVNSIVCAVGFQLYLGK